MTNETTREDIMAAFEALFDYAESNTLGHSCWYRSEDNEAAFRARAIAATIIADETEATSETCPSCGASVAEGVPHMTPADEERS